MKTRLFALLTLLLLGHAASAAGVILHPRQPSQNGPTLRLGLIVEAWSPWIQLSVAGGFTVQCDFTSLTIDDERADGVIDFPGTEMLLAVPLPTPGDYLVPSYNNIQANTCRSCTFKYRGSAVEGSASISGAHGINYTFSPGTPVNTQSTIVFNICRSTANPQCCTPGCAIP